MGSVSDGSASTWANTFMGLRGTSSSSELPSSPSLFLSEGGLWPNLIPCAICFCSEFERRRSMSSLMSEPINSYEWMSLNLKHKLASQPVSTDTRLTCRFLTLSETFSCDMLRSRQRSVSSGMKMLSCERARDPTGFNSLQRGKSELNVASDQGSRMVTHFNVQQVNIGAPPFIFHFA